MNLSRRQFVVGSGMVALPLLGVPTRAAPIAQSYEVGAIWGMPFLARGAEPARTGPRHRPANAAVMWSYEFV